MVLILGQTAYSIAARAKTVIIPLFSTLRLTDDRTDNIMIYRSAWQTKNIQIETLPSLWWWSHVPTLWWRWWHSVLVSRHSQISPDTVSWAQHRPATLVLNTVTIHPLRQLRQLFKLLTLVCQTVCLEHVVGHAFKFRKMKFLTIRPLYLYDLYTNPRLTCIWPPSSTCWRGAG